MTGYQVLQEMAADQFGLVTAKEASEAGVGPKALNALARRGRLERRGHGVYRVLPHVPGEMDRYAEALALVGEGALVWGESVLAVNGLGLVEPSVVWVRAARRCRKKLPSWVRLAQGEGTPRKAFYEGVACQEAGEAIRSCRGHVMPERLVAAVREARRKGLLGAREAAALAKEVRP